MIIIVSVVAGLLILALAVTYICFHLTFYSKTRRPLGEDEYDIPDGEVYQQFRPQIITWTKEKRALPHQDVSITSFDGLTLRGQYFECDPKAPMEIMFPGYRGNAERDLAGGVHRAFALGRNVLLVDQRAAGYSDGHIISFGINEHKDCLKWVGFAISHFGKDVKIILTGISMGASTVLLASGYDLPENVIGILADCGYTSAKDIIKKVIRQIKLPPALLYPIIRFGGMMFGGFDIESVSPIEQVKKCKIPVIFVHGETDDFVPFSMSQAMYNACTSKKKLIAVPNAGHGLAYPVAQESYIEALRDFEKECAQA